MKDQLVSLCLTGTDVCVVANQIWVLLVCSGKDVSSVHIQHAAPINGFQLVNTAEMLIVLLVFDKKY